MSVSSSSRRFLSTRKLICVLLLTISSWLHADEIWNAPALSASPASLQQAAATVKADKDAVATILVHDERYAYNREGKAVETYHTIYRIENEEGVSGWAETSARWDPWYQSKPEVRARVITTDGVEHILDLKTLNDVPAHENSPDTYTDQRSFGGPLPAISVGAIVEEETTIRDTVPFFGAGIVQRSILDRSVPVNKTRIIVSHPESLPFHYIMQQMPGAKVNKTSHDGIETIEIEDGPYEARSEKLTNLPPDVPRGPQLEFSTGASWQNVVAEYARLSSDKLRVADVQSLLGKINLKTSSRAELVRRLVAGLHKNVRYTGVEFGEDSIVPQYPSETLKRKYGDCKDKAALLVTLLRAQNIPAYLALLSTGPGQDINPELPGMGMFDHAIVFVPASGSEPELWIDATAQYSRVGDLPRMDYGRWALVVDENKSGLKKIPELTAAQNFHRELREFTLAEFGQAVIRETDEQFGPRESEFREFYSGDAKNVREGSEKYVKNAYLADSLTALEHGDLSDLERPFSLTFVTKGKRGTTDYESAVMAIRVEDLMDGFPAFFTTKPAKENEADKEGESPKKHKPRTADWFINPFSNEWDYKIIAPLGFKLRALPPSREQEVGSAKFSQKYSSNAEGTVVQAVLRFESSKTRLSVKDAAELRDAVVKAQASDPIFVTFDQVAHSLIASGKIKDGLAEYQQLARQHPKEALHRIQLARALLSAGLAENARVVARQATSLEPSSAQAYSTLAWILEHDLIGRLRKKGYDLQGAIAAYRKAKELDPKDKDIRANLAMLLEYDSNGDRYIAKAQLKDAISEFKDLKKLDEAMGSTYDDFVLYDLWYAREFKALEEALQALPSTDTRRGFVVAVTAINQGSEAALRKSLEITTSNELSRKALTTAGWLLLRLHKYSEAADLLTAGARGESTETQTATFAATLKKIKPREELKIDDTDPRSAIQHFFAETFSAQPSYEHVMKLFSRNAIRSSDAKNDAQEFHQSMFQLKVELEKSGVPLETAGDIVLNNARYSVEGDDAQGYRITAETPGSAPQQAFIVKQDGSFKILEYSFAADKSPENLGWQALELLNKNDLSGARQWLDWAREKIHMNGSDDPLAVQPFPYFWTKGQEGDAEAIRTAALVLVPSKGLKGDDLRALLHARDKANTDLEKTRLDVVAASAYLQQERWGELEPVATRLIQAFPDSMMAFQWITAVYAHTLRFDDWDKLVQDRMAKHRDELDYTRSAAQLARYRGDFIKSRQLMKDLADHSKATQSDLNSFAWDALFLPGEIAPETIEAAERANQLSKNSNYSIMHTLACLYAHAGKAAQARELMLKAMDGKLEEPESSVWLAYGQIAEAYGEPDAAQAMYARVDKAQAEAPTSNFALAQQRLLALKNTPATSAKNSGQ
jgi:Flp pilus assembly protein TadD/transglutaminase-like putative cysteine protease